MQNQTIKINKLALTRAIALATLTTAASQAQATNYTFSDLGTVALAPTTPIAIGGINNLGHVVGIRGSDSTLTEGKAVKWNGTAWSELGNITGGTTSIALAINDQGQTSGYISHQPNQDLLEPVRWESDGSVTSLQHLTSTSWFSRPEAINASGRTSGFGFTDHFQAAHWDASGNVQLLASLPGGRETFVQDMNDAGEMVGDAYTSNGDFDPAAYWDANGNPFELHTFSGNTGNGWATAINNLGQIVGMTTDVDGSSQAAYWNSYSAQPELLQPLTGLTGAVAGDINDSGQILGWAYDSDNKGHALLWDHGTVTDLTAYLPAGLAAAGWRMGTYLDQLNNKGQIIGGLSGNGLTASFMLTPTAVPVPGAVWLFGSALAGLLGVKRHKHALQA